MAHNQKVASSNLAPATMCSERFDFRIKIAASYPPNVRRFLLFAFYEAAASDFDAGAPAVGNVRRGGELERSDAMANGNGKFFS